jgi:hypothetical protein
MSPGKWAGCSLARSGNSTRRGSERDVRGRIQSLEKQHEPAHEIDDKAGLLAKRQARSEDLEQRLRNAEEVRLIPGCRRSGRVHRMSSRTLLWQCSSFTFRLAALGSGAILIVHAYEVAPACGTMLGICGRPGSDAVARRMSA